MRIQLQAKAFKKKEYFLEKSKKTPFCYYSAIPFQLIDIQLPPS